MANQSLKSIIELYAQSLSDPERGESRGMFRGLRNELQQPTPVLAPEVNPMSQINPYYTQQQTDTSSNPLAMYQQFKQSGQMPNQQSNFAQWSAPQAPQAAPTTQASPQALQAMTGGK